MADAKPNSVQELLTWCRDVTTDLRKLLLDEPSVISETSRGDVKDYAVKAAAYASALLPRDLAEQVPSPDYLPIPRSVLAAIDACERACESALQRGPQVS